MSVVLERPKLLRLSGPVKGTIAAIFTHDDCPYHDDGGKDGCGGWRLRGIGSRPREDSITVAYSAIMLLHEVAAVTRAAFVFSLLATSYPHRKV